MGKLEFSAAAGRNKAACVVKPAGVKPDQPEASRLRTYADTGWLKGASPGRVRDIEALHAQVLRDCGESHE